MAIAPGASGYFSAPSDTLDPNLFDGMELKGAVRGFLLDQAYDAMSMFNAVPSWLEVWLAGSGITYQWEADRGNGDLDVLMGVDIDRFTIANPGYAQVDETGLRTTVNTHLKEAVWPATSAVSLGGRVYEITFFWSEAHEDIKVIRPYAAYDVCHNSWVVMPPPLPSDPASLYPQEWHVSAQRDVALASELLERHDTVLQQYSNAPEFSAGKHNSLTRLNLVRAQLGALWEDIHGGRKAAFSEMGQGYGDWANFRWQSAKKNGVIAAIKPVVSQSKMEAAERDKSLYGTKITGAQETLARAERWKSGRVN